MKIAWVLSGGGAKGAFQVGVAKQLYEAGMKPDAIYGTSVGALNACGLSYGGVLGAQRIWLSVKKKSDILTLNWWKLPFVTGFYSTKPLRKIVEGVAEMGPSQCEAVACYVDLYDQSIHYGYNSKLSKKDFINTVIASATIPTAMEAVDGRYVDGGVREQTPLKRAIADGADKIIVILCNPLVEDEPEDGWKPSFPKALSCGLRALDIMEHEVFVNDVDKCVLLNSDPSKKKIEITLYCPDKKYMDTLEFDPAKIREAMEAGYRSIPKL